MKSTCHLIIRVKDRSLMALTDDHTSAGIRPELG